VEKAGAEEIVEVVVDGKLLTRYHYGTQWKKPFLWPVNIGDGVTVTRDYPMNPEGTPKLAQDHPHHKSLWSAYGEVRLVDGPPETHDLWAEGDGSGNQRAKDVTWGSGDAFGWIKSDNVWETGAGEPLIRETREYRFYAAPENGRLIDVKVTFTAEFGDAEFKDTKEGGIVAVRMRPDICNAKAVITNALGDEGEKAAWGKPAPWCDFSGDSPAAGWLGLAVFDHPGNPRHPSSWHVRNYGLMGANAFGYSHFIKEAYNKGLIPENGDLVIKKDAPVTFNYRVYAHKGNVKEAAVADRYADYKTPPEASWK
ncbi:MAG TPA: PmoA family protein, partial [Candidatus Hydrogenedentes bacterium]|nr:PmoA family protein [Candidatus Hydrogenedentota bacterium]